MSASYYSWQDFAYEYGEYEDDNYVPHHHTCELVSVGKPKEDYWREFMGTFDEGDDSVHGIVLKGVTCACGRIENREFRWTANMQEVAAAVFEEAFGKKSDDAD